MSVRTQARADWRALTGAALIGSGVGLALGAAYMAGGMARADGDHARSERLAEAAAGGFSESALQRQAASMDPGVLRVARRHDPFTVAGSAERDRQSAILAGRLEKEAPKADKPAKLAASFNPGRPASPFHLAGPLESSRELECLTQAVYFEARGETPAGQAAVAQVVLNRVRHSAFPKTVCGVVYQGAARRKGCQFSFACDGSVRRTRETAAWGRAQRVASKALSGAVQASIGDATHFHTINVAPNWGPRLIRTAQVGLHVFYKFGRGAVARSYAANSAEPELTSEPVYASLTSAPAPTAPTEVSADYRLASAVKVESETPKTAADAGSEVSATATEPKAKAAEPAKLTPASAPRAPEAAVKSPA